MARMTKPELIIKHFLERNNIKFDPQYKFDDCRFIQPLPFDFAVFDEDYSLRMLIEYDGIRHFKDILNNGTVLEKIVLKDKIKTDYCKEKNIPLLRIPYIFESKDKIEEILNLHLIKNHLLINYNEACIKDIDLEPVDDIEINCPFEEYNIDSIIEIYLTGKLEDFYDCFDYSDPEDYSEKDYSEFDEWMKYYLPKENSFKENIKLYELNGQEKSLYEWCKYYNIKYVTVKQRLKYGWEFNENLFNKNFKRPRHRSSKLNSKLSEDDVREIKHLLKTKSMSVNQIMQKYKISEPTVYRIKNNQSWKWVV